MAAGIKDIGVRAVVRNFGQYMSSVRAVERAGVSSAQNIGRALRKLEAQRQRQLEIQDDLVEKGKEGAAQMRLSRIAVEEIGDQMDELVDKMTKTESGWDNIIEVVSSLAGPLAQVAALLGLAKMTLDNWTRAIKVLIAPVTIAVKVVKSLATAALKVAKAMGSILISGIVLLAKGLWNVGKIAAGIAAKGLTLVFNIVKKLASLAVGALRKGLDLIVRGLKAVASVALGVLKRGLDIAVQGFKKLYDIMKDVFGLAEEGAEAFQALTIRFQGLVANEIKATGRTEDFAEAMRMAEEPSRRMLEWMQQLAVSTPFSRKDISETMAFSMAMGFTAKQSKDLTLAIGDFVSGMGLGTEVMERIVLQFGQMQAGGKLFGTELRDLARGAFVPINDLLDMVAEKTDMTADAWRELAATGATDIQPFFDAFIEMAGERFPNAMARMNMTMRSVRQNIKDFITEFLGVKMLGPVMDRLSQRMANSLEKMMSPDVLKAFERIGEQLDSILEKIFVFTDSITEQTGGIETLAINAAALFSVLLDFAEELVSAWTGVRQEFEYVTEIMHGEVEGAFIGMREMALRTTKEIEVSVSDWVDKAFNWGADLIFNFAEGMISAANTALRMAIDAIAWMLTHWFAPGSPPLIVPLIDEWGRRTLEEWLLGMTMADFDILDAVQGPLRQAFDTLEGLGVIGEGAAGGLFGNVSQQLIQALMGEGVDESIFGIIRESVGEFGEEIEELTRREIALADAIGQVERAEQALEDARLRHAQATVSVAEEQRAYNELLRRGGTDEQLRAALERVNAAEVEMDLAADGITVAEEELTLAQEQRDIAQEAAQWQQRYLDNLFEIIGAQIEANDKMKKGMDGIADAIDRIKDSMGGVGFAGIGESLGLAFEEAKRNIKAKLDNMWKDLRKRWNEDLKPLVDDARKNFNELKLGILEITKRITSMFRKMWGTITGYFNYFEFVTSPGFIGATRVMIWFALIPLRNKVQEVKDKVAEMESKWKDIKKGSIPWVNALGNLASALTTITGIFGNENEEGSAETALNNKTKTWIDYFTEIGENVETWTGWIDDIASAFAIVADWLETIWSYRAIFGLLSDVAKGNVGAVVADVLRLIGYGDENSYQSGAWNIPHDQVAKIHAGEMILPPQVASMVRGLATGPGVNFGDVHVNNDMDEALFMHRVQGAVSRAMSY